MIFHGFPLFFIDFQVSLRFAHQYLDPGETQLMSAGERGCAHSHRRLWELAAGREQPTLVLEDDVHLTFDRNGDLGKMNGKVFTKRLEEAMKRAPSDFEPRRRGKKRRSSRSKTVSEMASKRCLER